MTRSYGDVLAVEDVSVEIGPPVRSSACSVPKWAGKTTLTNLFVGPVSAAEQWVWPGRPEGGPESGSAVTVGDATSTLRRRPLDRRRVHPAADLLAWAWVYMPDAAAAE